MNRETHAWSILDGLPGGDSIREGLVDIDRSCFDTIEALLVLMGAPRMAQCGFEQLRYLPDKESIDLEHRLYGLLSQQSPEEAFGRYVALKTRLSSFLSALEMRCRRENSRSVP